MSETRAHYRGCMLGLAIGDALGMATEFLSLEEIRAKWGPQGIQDFPGEIGVFTDDTEMTIATARALLDSDSEEVDAVMEAIARRYVEWLDHPGYAPGQTCMRGAHAMKQGRHWRESGDINSKGCGSAMRSAPIGLRCRGNEGAIRRIGIASSLCTHGHPCALAGSVATAYLVSMALDGIPPERMHAEMRRVVEPISGEFVTLWDRIPALLDDNAEDVCLLLGEGWVAEEAVACAFWCFWKSPGDYAQTVLHAVNSSGDSDSIGCIAGAISGAYLGEEAIPSIWRERIDRREELLLLAEELNEAAISPTA